MSKILFALILIFSVACSEKKEDQENTATDNAAEVAATKTYACPMQCEGDKTYSQAGKCPVCKMDLKEVAMLENDSTAHDHQ